MESSSNQSLSHLSLSTQTSPSKLFSLSNSFSLSSSVPIRAPLTLDDEENDNDTDLEPKDNKFDSPSTTVSFIDSELESNEDDPDEENRPFALCFDENGLEENAESFVRPFAQLSCDNDDYYDYHYDYDFDRVELSPSVAIVEKISVAPRVKSFEGSENDFRSNEEEEQEGCDLGASEEEMTNKSSKCDAVVIKNCGVAASEEDAAREGLESHEGCEESNSTASEGNSDAGVSWVSEECSSSSEEVVVAEKSSKLDVRFERVNDGHESVQGSDVPNSEEPVIDSGPAEDYNEFDPYKFSDPNEEAEEIVNSRECNFSVLIEAVDAYEACSDKPTVDSEGIQNDSSVCNEANQEETMAEKEQSLASPLVSEFEDDSEQFDGLDEAEIKKIELLRVNFLRIVHRLGVSFRDPEVTRVLNHSVFSNHFGSIESTMKMALDFEYESETSFDFSLNILVLGKSGVGKSATINLIFGENNKAVTNAFKPATTSLKEIVGTVNGVKVTVLDTPGLKVSASEQCSNRKLLWTMRKQVKKLAPDIVLYVDRLDTETSDTDFPIVKLITDCLGPSIWKNTIITLTHSSSAGDNMVATRKSSVILDCIGKFLGDAKLRSENLGCRVSLVENNPTICGDSNGRSKLLLLCYSTKVLSLANFVPKAKGYRFSEAMVQLFSRSFCSDPELGLGKKTELEIHLDSLISCEISDDDNIVTSANNVLSCVPRNKTRLRNLKIKQNPFIGLALFRNDHCCMSTSAFLQARFEIRRAAKMAVRLVAGDPETARIQVMATGSGLLPVVLAGVLQMAAIQGL